MSIANELREEGAQKCMGQHFTQDYLLEKVRGEIKGKLKGEVVGSDKVTQVLNSIMSGLAVFTFKYPSLLQFDELRNKKEAERKNVEQLFGVTRVPCDTHMRSTLDEVSPEVLRSSFKAIMSLLQRAKILEQYKYLDEYYLISVDGTGYFSSSKVHCAQCLVKEHKTGKEYHHQMLSAAMVHPKQKVVFPLCPEPIMNTDGSEKNDCERNAFKRWIKRFRIEHPHLKGYAFEHNFGHGNKNLSTVFAFLMMLSFFIDQCLQGVNKLFQKAYENCRAKYALWERMRAAISRYILPSFEKLYEVIIHPPPPINLMGCKA